MDEFRAIVRGRVQGVGFRNFVWKHANQLGIKGLVRNLPDWTVEVVAQGDVSTLKQLIEHLHKGPFFSKVTKVEIEWRRPSSAYKAFQIE